MPSPSNLPETLDDLTPDLMRVARHLTGQADPAQDLCQETLLRLWRRRDAVGDIENFRAYAMTTLRNLHRQSLRNSVVNAELEETHQTTDPEVFATLALQELKVAIDRLPAGQAQLIRMVAAGETSPQELAKHTGLRIGTVMSRLARARAQLRKDMGIPAQAPVNSLF